MAERSTRFLDYLEKIIMTIIGVMLMIMTASIFYQVILRYIFDAANVWAEELTRYLFVWITFLGASVAIRRSRHLTIEFFINLLGKRAKAILQIIIYTFTLIFLAVVLKNGIVLVLRTTNTLSAGMMIPMAIPYAAIPAGAFLMILYSIELILKQLAIVKNYDVCKQKTSKINKAKSIMKEG